MTLKRKATEHAKQLGTHRVPSSTTDDSIYSFFSSLNCPESLSCWLLYENKEYQQLVDKGINPMHYNCAFEFRDAYTAINFLSKADFLPLSVSKSDAAFEKFFEYEQLCGETNSRFRDLSLDPSFKGANCSLLTATIEKMDRILGGFGPDEFVDGSNWGPGVTTLLKGQHVSATNKFHSENGITRGLYSLVGDWFHVAYPSWAEVMRINFGASPFSFEVGNKIVTVPKNSKTDRVIAVEPGLNLYFQKGVGAMIRRRLQREGIDLTDQTRNQRLSAEGSRTGQLATVDFSSASDSISRELVRVLIKDSRWATLLFATRSPFGTHNNKTFKWEKFSSMGNGFTFELESLIFYAAASAVREYLGARGEISVFGDDVILPSSCYELFSAFSAFLGFRVNPKKSFSSSEFRESCGAHWFAGVDVKPVFLKEKLHNVQAIFKLANNVRNLAHRRNSSYGCDARFKRCWNRLVGRVPKRFQLRTPYGYGDIGFSVNFDESHATIATNRWKYRGFEGFLCNGAIETGVTQYFEQPALLLARLKAASSPQAYGNTYTLRSRTRLRIKPVLVPSWYNYGPWF